MAFRGAFRITRENKLIFISGGVRSGKSTFAEQLATSIAIKNDEPLYYIATSKADDQEMKKRIERHQNERMSSGFDWHTIEISENFSTEVTRLPISGVVLMDCLTVLTANELFQQLVPETEILILSELVKQRILDGLRELRKKTSTLLVVSNEIHYEYNHDVYVQTYQRLLGELHQEVVNQSTQSYLVEASIPLLMKP